MLNLPNLNTLGVWEWVRDTFQPLATFFDFLGHQNIPFLVEFEIEVYLLELDQFTLRLVVGWLALGFYYLVTTLV